jgi:hypothetical protein
MAFFTETELWDKTRAELKEICAELSVNYKVKDTKETLIDLVLDKQEELEDEVDEVEPEKEVPVGAAAARDGGVVYLNTQVSSVRVGDGIENGISVSCGANSGNFPVVGKTVEEVADFLREALNIDVQSSPLVNGRAVGNDFVLSSGDSLEYTKAAGRKG